MVTRESQYRLLGLAKQRDFLAPDTRGVALALSGTAERRGLRNLNRARVCGLESDAYEFCIRLKNSAARGFALLPRLRESRRRDAVARGLR